MAAADQQQPSKFVLLTFRSNTDERAHLHRIAAERGTTLSGLVREGLAAIDAALPAEAA